MFRLSDEKVLYVNKENELRLLKYLNINIEDIKQYSVVRAIVDVMIEYEHYIEKRDIKSNLAFGFRSKLANTYIDYHLEKWISSFCNLVEIIEEANLGIDTQIIRNESGIAFYQTENQVPIISYFDNIKAIRNKTQHRYNNLLDILKTQIILKMFKDKMVETTKKYQIHLVSECLNALREKHKDDFCIANDIMKILNL